ncbi:MAG: hypothetical protein KY464_00940 [Gemmatimonadetes bacterium]|nr:hypothetical protein [Gemmatimonadota bacterium]
MKGRSASLLLAVALGSVFGAPRVQAQASFASSVFSAAASAPPAATNPLARERVFGRSGALRVFPLRGVDALELPYLQAVTAATGTRFRWAPLLGTRSPLLGQPVFSNQITAPGAVGMWRLEAENEPSSPMLTVITEAPFAMKRDGLLNGYHIGYYPSEGADRSNAYAPPPGFIEVTPENQDLQISEHFRLRQFITKDQAHVWPKYVALRLELIDKLELVLQELNRMGVRADRMYVMSGFRTPQYNGPGGDGRAQMSRHMYGDAADVWIDNDGNGYIDDLNGDGYRDERDNHVLLRAVERVEQKHPDLVGGAGFYYASDTHGPFVHIDVRGNRARW